MALTAITLGNFYTTNNGKTVLGDTAGTGLDTQALINALTTATEVQATQDQTQITTNNAKASAFSQLQSLLTNYQSAAAALSNPQGIFNASTNVFAATAASVGNGGTAYVSATTTAGASPQTYNISNISSLASVATQASGVFNVSSANADATTGSSPVFTPGTITFASGATVTVNSGDSLNTIATDFNAVSSRTGINASVVQIDSSHYQLDFTATKTGTNANFDLTSSSTVTSGSSVLSSIGLGAAVSGTNAIFKLNGTTITRQSNTVSDAVNDVTFNLLQKTPDTTTVYPVSITPNTSGIITAVQNFISAYNALQTFGAQQTALKSDGSGTFASSAVLASDSTFQSIMNSVDREVNSQVAGITGSNPTNLSQIGLTFTNQTATSSSPAVSNLLTLDTQTLTNTLTSNFTGVQNVFGLNASSSNANFALYSHTKAIGVTDFTVNIDPSTNTFTATYTQNGQVTTSNLTATAMSGLASGYTLTGDPNSPLAGTTFLYVSTAAATINMHVSQGIADQANIFSTSTLTTSTGPLAVAQAGIQSSNTQLNKDITNIKTQANSYQQTLVAQFAALQQAITSSNTLLASLNANSNAALESANA